MGDSELANCYFTWQTLIVPPRSFVDRVLYLVDPFETTSNLVPNPSAVQLQFWQSFAPNDHRYKVNKQETKFNHNFFFKSGILRSCNEEVLFELLITKLPTSNLMMDWPWETILLIMFVAVSLSFCDSILFEQRTTLFMVFSVTCVVVLLTLFWGICYFTWMIHNFITMSLHDTWHSSVLTNNIFDMSMFNNVMRCMSMLHNDL